MIYPPGYLPEFANNGYIIPLDPYLGVRDPKMDDIVESFRKLYCEYDGKTYSVPYDGDIHIFYYRQDLVEDPTEKKNFKAKYGYELGVPETWDEVKDFAEFFTRKAGQKLGGSTLEKDFYGNGMMLSRFWCIYEFIDHFASYGGDCDLIFMSGSALFLGYHRSEKGQEIRRYQIPHGLCS